MTKQQKAEMEHGLEAADRLAYLASDFPHSRLLENQALYRSVLEKNCPKQGLSLSVCSVFNHDFTLSFFVGEKNKGMSCAISTEPDMVTLKRNYLITVKKCATIYTLRLC
jgi:hypothetical protein